MVTKLTDTDNNSGHGKVKMSERAVNLWTDQARHKSVDRFRMMSRTYEGSTALSMCTVFFVRIDFDHDMGAVAVMYVV